MVERSLSMREVPGSIPGASRNLLFFFIFFIKNKLHMVKKMVKKKLNQ